MDSVFTAAFTDTSYQIQAAVTSKQYNVAVYSHSPLSSVLMLAVKQNSINSNIDFHKITYVTTSKLRVTDAFASGFALLVVVGYDFDQD